MTESRKKLLLIDAMASLYRSYFAMARVPLKTPDGRNVAALFGFMNTLFALLEREHPEYLAVCSDTAEPTLRHQAYAEYKATREAMPDDLQVQVPLLYGLLEAMKIPLLYQVGYEADDIIATLTVRAASIGYEPIVVSGDKDLLQLLSQPGIRVLSPSRTTAGEWNEATRDTVLAKYGVPPERLGDWLAMVGDTSDNVPGIPKIGGKSATELLNQFGSLESVLTRVDEIEKKAQRETITANTEQARLSRQLVELQYDAPAPSEIESLTYGPFVGEELRDRLNELGFRSLLQKVLTASQPEVEPEERDYQSITTLDQLRDIMTEIESAELVALDTETDSIDPNLAKLVGISLAMKPCHAWFIHLPSFTSAPMVASNDLFSQPSTEANGNESQLEEATQTVLDIMRPWLSNPLKKKCGQNFKYDTIVFANAGVEVQGWCADSMLMSYLLDPNSRSHSIDLLSQKYLQLPKIPTHALIGSGKQQITMLQVPLDRITEYACEDADYTLRLVKLLTPKLKVEQLNRIHEEIEVPLAMVLARVERTGIRIDPAVLSVLSNQFGAEQIEVEREVHRLAGHPFNLNSPLQLSKVLFDELKLKPARKTKTGFSTDEDALQKMVSQDPSIPLPPLLLRYRRLSKLRGTYVDALPKLINPRTGRVHSSFHQAVASTGRLSSSDPNLQNIPIRTEEGAQIRTAFIAGEPGWKILSADYSQIELRLMAHMSSDAALCEAFRAGHDIHAATAAKVFSIPIEEVTREQRGIAKGVNFGIIYGQTDFGLSEALSIPLSEAKEFRRSYFEMYPGVKTYMESTVEVVRECGYATTLLGRKRPIPDIKSDNRATREFAERTAINTPIQGTAADIIKLAMIEIDRELEARRSTHSLRAKMLLQVHDELVFEAPIEELDELSQLVREEMEQVMTRAGHPLSVPLVADIGIGDNWLAAH